MRRRCGEPLDSPSGQWLVLVHKILTHIDGNRNRMDMVIIWTFRGVTAATVFYLARVTRSGA